MQELQTKLNELIDLWWSEADAHQVLPLDDRFGDGSVIVLKPDVNAASGIVDWNCEVKGDPALKQAMPRCKG